MSPAETALRATLGRPAGGTERSKLAGKTRSSFEKRQKEVARQARQKAKQAKLLEAKQKKIDAEAEAAPESVEADEDPDLAGIVPGPQPPT